MRELLIIETRDAADHKDAARIAELAAGMSRTGVPATIFLAENGAFNARSEIGELKAALAGGVRVAVDGFSLEERGIDAGSLTEGVCVADVDLIVDRLAGGDCVMWR
jgi:hypothetical protein